MTATGWADTVVEDGPVGWPAERARLERECAELTADRAALLTSLIQMGESVRLMECQRDRADTFEYAFRSLARSYGQAISDRNELFRISAECGDLIHYPDTVIGSRSFPQRWPQ